MDEHEAAELDTPSGTTGGTVAETPASPGDRPSARPAGRAKGTMIALAGGVLALVLVALLIVSRLSGGGSTGLSGAQASATAQAAGTVAALATTVAQSVATARAAPTATAEALAGLLSEAHVVNATHVPGPGCDSGGAVWVVSDGATVKCLRGGCSLRVARAAKTSPKPCVSNYRRATFRSTICSVWS